MTSKELVALLVERGYEIKSASSSIDNITAESLIEELKPAEAEVVEVEESDVAEPETDDKPEESADEEPSSDDSTVAGPIVKSKQDIDRERLEKQEAEDRAKEASSPGVSPDASELPSDPGAVPLAPPPPAPFAPTPPKPSAIMAPPPPSTGKSAEPATSEDAPAVATVAPTSSNSTWRFQAYSTRSSAASTWYTTWRMSLRGSTTSSPTRAVSFGTICLSIRMLWMPCAARIDRPRGSST